MKTKIKKYKGTAKLKKELWPIFSQYIRLRDCLLTTGSIGCGECFTCDNPPQHRFEDLDAGHFIPTEMKEYYTQKVKELLKQETA